MDLDRINLKNISNDVNKSHKLHVVSNTCQTYYRISHSYIIQKNQHKPSLLEGPQIMENIGSTSVHSTLPLLNISELLHIHPSHKKKNNLVPFDCTGWLASRYSGIPIIIDFMIPIAKGSKILLVCDPHNHARCSLLILCFLQIGLKHWGSGSPMSTLTFRRAILPYHKMGDRAILIILP